MTEEKKREISLLDDRINYAEFLRQDFVVNAEEGTTIEDVLKPAYWQHVQGTKGFKQFDHIEVRQETGEWVAELMVVSPLKGSFHVHLLKMHELPPPGAIELKAADYRVEWKGPQHKYSVIRKAGGEYVQDGFADKEAATRWLANHERVTA